MHLNPYGEYAVKLAGSLADDWPVARPGLLARMRDFDITALFDEQPDDHAAARRVIDEWLTVVDEPAPERRAALLNAQLAGASALPQLTNHNDDGWHLHYRDVDASLPRVLAAVVSVGTALHLTTRGMHRLGRCAAAPCTNVVVDTSRNGTQRYCSPRCGTRDAVRRHRARGATR